MAAAGRFLGGSSPSAHSLRTARDLDRALGHHAHDCGLEIDSQRNPFRRAHENACAARAGKTRPETGIHSRTPPLNDKPRKNRRTPCGRATANTTATVREFVAADVSPLTSFGPTELERTHV